MSDITKHKWSERNVTAQPLFDGLELEIENGAVWPPVAASTIISKEDAVAISRYFGLIEKSESMEEFANNKMKSSRKDG